MPTARAISPPLIVGSLIFGVGWGLAGICPGPAIVDVGFLNPRALVFVAAMACGMLAYQTCRAALARAGSDRAGCLKARRICRHDRTHSSTRLIRQPLAAGAVLFRARSRPGGLAGESRPARLRSCRQLRLLHRGQYHARRARHRRSDADGVVDRDRHLLRLREFRFAHRRQRAQGLAAMDGEHRFQRAQTQIDVVDRRDIGDQAAGVLHGDRA